MAVAEQHREGTIIERVLELVRASGRGVEAQVDFAGLLFAHGDEAELRHYAPEALAALGLFAWEFVSRRSGGRHAIRAFNPDRLGPRRAPVTVIEILNDDMPFLVDSVMGEIQERGLEVRLVLHPVYAASRDADGWLQSVAPRADRSGARESYIQIHLDCIEDEAALEDLKRALSGILDNVRTVVRDWQPMLERLTRAIAAYSETPPPVPRSDLAESIEFLKWLRDDHFTFLGMRAMAYVGGTREGRLEPAPDSGLGILRDPDVAVLRRGAEAVHMTPEIRKFFLGPEPLIITKANVRSTVHRRTHMDYVGVKIYSEAGEISGELRIVGLFTSAAYTGSVRRIPFLRHKVATLLRRANYDSSGHAGKTLLNVLETFPRDELFQIGGDLLHEWATGILSLELKPRTRVFARIDEFDRFVSLLVYVPRDRFSTHVRQKIGAFLAEAYRGHVSAFYPYIPEGPLVRVHFIIGRGEGATPVHDPSWLEEAVRGLVRTWQDTLEQRIADRLDPGEARRLTHRYLTAFPVGYQESSGVDRALEDITQLERLAPDRPIAIDVYREDSDPPDRARVTLYHLDGPIPLSRRVPILENFGFDVVYERSYEVSPNIDGAPRYIALHDMVVGARDGGAIDVSAQGRRIEDGFLAVWRGEAANDGFNRLVLSGAMDWRQAAVFRAYGSYLRQIRAPFGQAYLSDTLVHHVGVTQALWALFALRFDPEGPDARERAERQSVIVEEIEAALDTIASLDEDRIVRHYRNLVCATMRTNFFARDGDGQPLREIAFKFDSAQVDALPPPRPFAEIFVFSPRVEGIHLRFGPVARGGVRWSDRLQDYRTEVLGLAKAQQVKNVIIVPTGAKGGFVPKLLPVGGTREAVRAEAIAAYKSFVSTLLSLTDNLAEGGEVVSPVGVVRHDGDDPYLVVAADKGTADFSDIANEIAIAHGFWLGDAFASGGSAGYDHKEMAITARGAWEAVKRHFREMDVDIQTSPFTVIGVGDMSGDVFGNGMLLSKTLRLLAAFDHRDIFIDPDPDTEMAWEERKRLFDLPRSSWQDYDASKISAGGGVFPRTAKSIPLSDEIKALTGLAQGAATPAELIRALLRAPADLMWFGGIGTYVKASGEADADVGDRSNDALRVLASELQVKVIGEGANLAMTQRGRIEFARAGGRVNTDAIDNSAGVNSSDLEVNIKIALRPAVSGGRLSLDDRNALLAQMSEEVAHACLRNNYRQSLALGLGARRGAVDLGFQARLIRELEKSGLLDAGLEHLPGKSEIEERQAAREGLTRPEIAVLLAYAKLDLTDRLLASPLPDDAYFADTLAGYFPATLRAQFASDIAGHRLGREIVATELANAVVNRGGSTMAVRLTEETGHGAADVALGFTVASAAFELETLWAGIDALDNRLSGARQLDLYVTVQDVLREQTAWFLRHGPQSAGLSETIAFYRSGLTEIAEALDVCLAEDQRDALATQQAALEQAGVDRDLARRLAALPYLADAPDAILVAHETERPVREIAGLFSEVAAHFRIPELRRAGDKLAVRDHFDRLAVNSIRNVLSAALRAVVCDVVTRAAAEGPDFAAWRARNGSKMARASASIDEILDSGTLTLSRLMVAATHLRDLARA